MRGMLWSGLFLLFFVACSAPQDKPLRISATTWIGYTPLYYAKEQGWLDSINVKLLNVVSLSENLYLYKAGNSDAYVGTQYERSVLMDKLPTLTPIMLFDHSFGGDMIMSNRSIKQLQSTQEVIVAYLEMDSINVLVLEDFLTKHALKHKNIRYINKDQAQILGLEKPHTPILIATYAPYDSALHAQGFEELASTKEGLDILVIDAMFTTHETLMAHKEQFLAIKGFVHKAIEALHADTKSYYETIAPYLVDISYEAFLDSLEDIKWMNESHFKELKPKMLQAAFPTKDLL